LYIPSRDAQPKKATKMTNRYDDELAGLTLDQLGEKRADENSKSNPNLGLITAITAKISALECQQAIFPITLIPESDRNGLTPSEAFDWGSYARTGDAMAP
jgi:hypothetical protein